MLLKEGTKTEQEFLHEFSPFLLHFQGAMIVSDGPITAFSGQNISCYDRE